MSGLKPLYLLLLVGLVVIGCQRATHTKIPAALEQDVKKDIEAEFAIRMLILHSSQERAKSDEDRNVVAQEIRAQEELRTKFREGKLGLSTIGQILMSYDARRSDNENAADIEVDGDSDLLRSR